MKKKLLSLLTAVLLCAFFLTGCSATQRKVEDEALVQTLTERAQETIDTIAKADDARLQELLDYYGLKGREPDRAFLSGLQSWENNRDELTGEMTVRSIEVIENLGNETYVAVGDLGFDSRDCEFRMVFNHQLENQSITFNPVYSFGEKMQKAGMNTLIGIFTVFLMLALISVIIYCFKFIHVWEEKRAAANNPAPAPAPAAAPKEQG